MVCTSLAWLSTLAAASCFIAAGAAAKAGVSMEAQSRRLAVRRRTEWLITVIPGRKTASFAKGNFRGEAGDFALNRRPRRRSRRTWAAQSCGSDRWADWDI